MKKAIHIDSPIPFSSSLFDNSISLYGSCDGLILCVTYPPRILLLLNPSTREQITLPHSPFHDTTYHVSYGFGYNASTDDYNIVAISCTYAYIIVSVCVYTQKTNSWRIIRDSPLSMVSDAPGTLFNGVLHWFAYENMSTVIAFHLWEEKFQNFPLPCFEAPSIPRFIGVLRGCLCITVGEPDTNSTEFWVMKEYGKRESWTKVATCPHYLTKPLNFTNNDEIQFLMDETTPLRSYNLKNNKYGSRMIPYAYGSLELLQYLEAEICLESIVSPNRHCFTPIVIDD
ncbi:F-box/kelch-repeat protein At3g06240-like [Cornus florida]|uniref:F-box/kelch-repeat protein At3g06240-like n=1 Tax=Cornus florida TaxID=4283 RepID=UPI002899D21E|nr:F-box/kelch-repeat protein At3g06240-like [Cornus florida]